MTRFWYDTEFLETGRKIHLISIGIVCEDGREYYAISTDLPEEKIARHPWLMANVVPSLPRVHGDPINRVNPRTNPLRLEWRDPAYKPYTQIAREVRAFLLHYGDPELWAWYASFDHVALAWLFGPMSDLPAGIPMYTNDLKQEAHRLGVTDDELPAQESGAHNALADARHNKVRHEWLIKYEIEHAD